SSNGTNNDILVTRYLADGRLDTSFGGGDGIVQTAIGAGDEAGNSIVLQSDGKFLVVGSTSNGTDLDMAVARYNTDGTLDTTFGGGDGIATLAIGTSDDVANAAAIQSDGKIVVVGRTVAANNNIVTIRLTTSGTLDTTFSGDGKDIQSFSSGNDIAWGVELQSNGKIVVAATAYTGGGGLDMALLRYNTDGTLDTTFAGNGKWSQSIFNGDDYTYDLAIQSNGKIVIVGKAPAGGGNTDIAVFRVSSTGTNDSFASAPIMSINSSAVARKVVVQSDGKVVLAGSTWNGSNWDVALVRFLAGGALDTTFGTGGIVQTDLNGNDDEGMSLVIDADGSILVTGTTTGTGDSDVFLLRYNSDGTLSNSTGLAALGGTVSFTEGGSAVVLEPNAYAYDPELDAAGDYSGATLTIARNGGTLSEDQFSFTGNLSSTGEGQPLILSAVEIGTVTTNSGGTLLITFNSNATQARVNEALQSIAYANGNDNPAASVQLDWTLDDGNTGAQGTGGALTASGSTTVNITAVNDAPLITSNGGGATAAVNVVENTTAVTTVNSSDPDGGTAVYSISGGADAAKFTINSSTGVLSFASAPDFETPTDSGANNVYDVQVTVSDGNGGTDSQAISVSVTDLPTAVLVVDTTSDVADGTTTSISALLSNKGADGKISLREAILAANATPNGEGNDRIEFNISDPLVAGVHRIQPTTPLPDITDAVIIDGTTDPDFAGTPVVMLDGNNGFVATAITLADAADGSTIRGLIIRDFTGYGILVSTNSDGNTIAGNWIGRFNGSGGDAGVGEQNTSSGIRIQGSNTLIGGSVASDRNLISGNAGSGISIASTATGTVIQGNYIGVDVTGTVAISNAGTGAISDTGAATIVGGTGAGEGNLISGNTGAGIVINTGAGSGHAVLGNTFSNNGGLGIDIEADGVTWNDVDDVDTGANDRLNFPILTNVVQNGSDLDITFAADLPAGTYRIEFYSNPSGADPSGYGEAAVYLGASSVTVAGSAGYESFTCTLTGVTPAQIAGMTATVTVDLGGGNFGSTSELGPAFTAAGELTVTTTNDTNDGDTSSIAALLGNRGADGKISLREAIIATNNTANIGGNPDAISFNLSTSDGGYVDPTPGSPGSGDEYWTMTPTSALPDITGAVIIDATTQPEFVAAPVIEINGTSAGAGVSGLTLADGSDGSTIRGFVINRFTADGIEIASGADGNVVAGNIIGLDVTGTIDLGNAGEGVSIRSAGNTIGGTSAADRNIISGNTLRGVRLALATATNNVVLGNYIGTDATGTTAIGNSNSGITIDFGANNNLIGGTTAADRNVISGQSGNQIRIAGGGTSGNRVEGNYIGPDATGTVDISTGYGIITDNGATSNVIGGTTAGAGNLIFGTANGVSFGSSTDINNAVLGNSIYNTGNAGIDLGATGVTYNDAEDIDSVSNDGLNFPVLTNVVQNGGDLEINFAVDLPAGTYRIEFFDNPDGLDASGFGEGQTFIGFATITATGAAGYESFSTTLNSVTASDIHNITVTATEDLGGGNYGSTSEFGPQFQGAGVITVTTTSDTSDGDTSSIAALLGNRGADGFVSLREAITAANNSANIGGNPDEIHFSISISDPSFTGISGVDGRAVITLAGLLPQITDAVVIDGMTQTTNVGDTNPGLLGTGGTVGVDGLTLDQVQRSEIEVTDGAGLTIGFDVGADNVTVRGLAIHGFGNSGNGDAAILVRAGVSSVLIEGNILGTLATGIIDPGSAVARNWMHVASSGGDNGVVRNNLMAYSESHAIRLPNASEGWQILNNEFRDTAIESANGDGIVFNTTTSGLVQGNLITGTSTQAITLNAAISGITIVNNTLTGNGVGTALAAPVQSQGIIVRAGTTELTI
ncbi:MAG: right-handed parallel beta-helix repeat-containing protein, partial [Planctomycetaceae bacterium]|nr:right-handed parallel beta-helix repeat-containing protein [Planctomycetaceae bacterium]